MSSIQFLIAGNCRKLPKKKKTMNVSGDTFIFVTVMLLMHCSYGICLTNIELNQQQQQQQQQIHDRTKRFVFLQSSGIGVS